MTTATDSERVLVDSSGWVEYFGEGPKAEAFAPFLEREDFLVLPTIVIYEVCRKLAQARGETSAGRFLSCAYRTRIVPLDSDLAIAAASVSRNFRLPMADAIIYATAQACTAKLVTLDAHFQGLPGATLL